MGILNGLTGNAGSSQQSLNPLGGLLGSLSGSGNSGLVTAAMSLLQQHGGISGVLDLFRSEGMGQQVQSWVGRGPNEEVSGAQVEQAFGSSAIGDVASKLGMSPGETGSSLARVLPEVVDRLTPDGEVPDNQHDLISRGLSMLRGGDA